MAKMGKFKVKGMKEFTEKLNQLDNPDAFVEACAKELAARLLRMVIKRTPVGDYSQEVEVTAKKDSKNHKKGDTYTKKVNQTGKQGGTLRRGWTGGKDISAQEYAETLKVQHVGSTYTIEIINPVEYASYVEFGHRQQPGRYVPAIGKQLKQGWVKGQFMMTISEQELQTVAPQILERKIKKYMKGIV